MKFTIFCVLHPVLTRAIADAPTQVVTVDACDDSDLAIIGQALVTSNCLPCGALGLARAWVKTLVGSQSIELAPVLVGSPAPVLVVAGSHHPKTHTQVCRLVAEREVSVIDVAQAKRWL